MAEFCTQTNDPQGSTGVLPMKFRFDTISFFIGMFVATIVWWVITLLRFFLIRWQNNIKIWIKERAQGSSSKLENDYFNSFHKQTQGMHLAASLFALDEIGETPRLLAPPLIPEPQGQRVHPDIVEITIPYLINYPELAAHYNAPTLSLSQAISGGMNLAILGQPGTGKTTALAWLASQISKSKPPENDRRVQIPFFIHAVDLGLPLHSQKKPEDFLTPIIDKVTGTLGIFYARQIPKFVESAFVDGRALLLLDGVDELPQSIVQDVSAYLRVLLRHYPTIQVILTGAPEYLGEILTLGFSPMGIMPWSNEQQAHFIENWGSLWQKNVIKEAWAQKITAPIDPVLLKRWLLLDKSVLTPLEITLKIWGAYAGDILSANKVDPLDAHIKRLSGEVPTEIIHMLAAQAILSESISFDARQAKEWMKSLDGMGIRNSINYADSMFVNGSAEIAGKAVALDAGQQPRKDSTTNTGASVQQGVAGYFSNLVTNGLLSTHPGNKMRFTHLVYVGYLAGKQLSTLPDKATILANQPAWSGQTTTLRYLAAAGDVTELVREFFYRDDPILLRPKFTIARILPLAHQSRGTTWWNGVMSELVQILQDDNNPFGLRGQALIALALSGDGSVNNLFRQLLQHPSAELRQLAALGVGFTRDTKAVDLLISLIENPMDATRRAACLALVEIGSPTALETVALSLLRGDEQLRIIAAEALANHGGEGQEALREGINSDDILVRRAILFGLSRIADNWSSELLEKIQMNDEQWAVRNLAVEILNIRHSPNPHIPKLLLPPHETPWLIGFAGKYGMGVTPGQPSTDILFLALKDKTADFFKPALAFLRNTPTEEVLAEMYKYLESQDISQKEAVYQVLSYLALGGITLPRPNK